MKKEHKYFGCMVLVFLFFSIILAVLFRKYSMLTFQHFLETCQQISRAFFTSGIHYIGFSLLTITILITAILLFKTLFSFVKTKNKLTQLLKYKTNKTHKKLLPILAKLRLSKDDVIVVSSALDHAFTFGLRSQKIVVSTALVQKLSSRQLEAVLLHEQYHSRHDHSILLLVSDVLSSAMFFLPLLKELARRMKIVFENQADAYAIRSQHTDKNLNSALVIVSRNTFEQYPGFAQRRVHVFSISSMSVTFSVIVIITVLFLLPVESHTRKSADMIGAQSACHEHQCSADCSTKSMSLGPIMSLGPTHSLSSLSY
jgi:hypothetical protein